MELPILLPDCIDATSSRGRVFPPFGSGGGPVEGKVDFCLLATCGEEGRVRAGDLNGGEGVWDEREVCDAPDGLVWQGGCEDLGRGEVEVRTVSGA